MTKKSVLGLLIITLLFCGGCDKKSNDPNAIEKMKAENAALKAKIQQLGTTSTEQQKKTQPPETLPQKAKVDPNIPPVPKKEAIADANGIVRVTKPFFGIYLGEKLDELNKRFRLRSLPAIKDDNPAQNWAIQSDNSNVSNICVETFNGYVFMILPSFKDASKENYEALKTQLEQTYGKGQKVTFFDGKGTLFLSTLDSTRVGIYIQYKTGEVDDLSILYVHKILKKKVDDEIKQRKLAKVKGDL